MRPSNKSRSRNKSGNPGGTLHSQQNRRNGGGNIINRVFDSAGPDGKVRGTPQQIIDKYLGLARDAQLAGDRVATESFLQHAEHYSRMLGEAQRLQNEQRGPSPERDDGQRDEGYRAEQRDGGGRDDRGQRSEQREPGERAPAFSSGFATIDPEDVEDPRDAPPRSADGQRGEDRRSGDRQRRESRPEEASAHSSVNGASAPQADIAAPEESAAPAPEAAKPDAPKRTRTRRKAPAAEPAPAAQAE
jgi:hypothetical protein